jgi:hypothetical protein
VILPISNRRSTFSINATYTASRTGSTEISLTSKDHYRLGSTVPYAPLHSVGRTEAPVDIFSVVHGKSHSVGTDDPQVGCSSRILCDPDEQMSISR